jgi:hypothetical protein
MEILWFIPTHGDGRYLATSKGERPTTLHYLTQVARAVDELGYYGVLVPTGRPCDDPWVAASALIPGPIRSFLQWRWTVRLRCAAMRGNRLSAP